MGLALTAALLAASIELSPPACRPSWFEVATFERLLETETSTTTRLYVAVRVPDCDERPNDVEVEIGQPSARRRETIALGDVDRAARLRTLVLAVAELLTSPLPAPPPRRAVASTPTPVEVAPSWQIGGAVLVRTLPSYDHALAGLGLVVRHRPPGWPLAATLQLGVEAGRTRVELGEVSVRSMSATLGVDIPIVEAPVEVFVGPRVEVGWAFLWGAGGPEVRSASGDGAFAVVAVGAGASHVLGDRLAVAFDISAGSVVRAFEATGDGTPIAGYAGAMIQGRLTAAWRF